MPPSLREVEVTLPGVCSGFREVHHGDGVDEQARIQPVRYLGVDVDDALNLAERTEV